MTGFADRFGGSGLTPTDVTYAQYTLFANLATYWPPYANPTNVLARQLDITAQGPNFSISLPDATLGSPGRNTMFRNVGIYPFAVTKGGDTPEARAFLAFLATPAVRASCSTRRRSSSVGSRGSS